MSAVLGGDRQVVLARLTQLNLVPANDNGGGQIVAAGDLNALAALAENPPEGARVRALAVAGAFHTDFMSSAVDPLRALASTINTHKTTTPIISNKEGAAVTEGVTGVIELPPAGTLVGLLKRGVPEIEVFALKTADDLSAAKEFAGRHL
jgi:[acyl-carrier-protein] S-malonyltransferase